MATKAAVSLINKTDNKSPTGERQTGTMRENLIVLHSVGLTVVIKLMNTLIMMCFSIPYYLHECQWDYLTKER